MISNRHKAAVILILSIMSILAFSNLGNRYMWLDESHTAMLGKGILAFGYPRSWDGISIITSANGNDFDQNFIFIKDNWVQHYLSAFGQIFGSTNFHIRFWFVILGVLSAIILYFLAYETTKNKNTALLSLGLYGLSIPVLLYIRQIRYYSPSLLFVILTYYCYVKYIEDPSARKCIAFIASSVLLFHSLYMYFMITFIVITIHFSLFQIKKSNSKGFLFSLILIFLFTAPWFIYHRDYTSKLGDIRTGFQGGYFFRIQALGYLWQIQTYFFPFLSFIAVLAFLKLIKVRKNEEPFDRGLKFFKLKNNSMAWLLILPILINVSVAALFSVQYATRYLIACLPFCYILNAKFVSYIISRDRLFGYIICLMLLFTNIIHTAPYFCIKYLNLDTYKLEYIVKPPVPFFNAQLNFPFKYDLNEYINNICRIRSYFLDYLAEITHDYDDATEGVIRFLQKYADNNDKVMVLGHCYDSISFYTDLQVVNRLEKYKLNDDSLYKIYPNVDKLYDLTRYPLSYIDWIVVTESPFYSSFQNLIIQLEKEELYQKYTIGYPDAPFSADIWEHTFTTNYSYPDVVIYRNKMTVPEIEAGSSIGKLQLESTF